MQTKIMRAQNKAATSDQLLQHSSSKTIPAIMHDRSQIFGTLVSIESIEEDSIIANFHMVRKDKRQTVTMDTAILLSTDYLLQLEPIKGQRVALACFDGRVHIRSLETITLEEPQATPRPHKAPVMAAIEQIRADQCAEFDYSSDLSAILTALQAAKGPLKTIEISMLCNLSDEAARKRIKILVDSGKVAHETIHRVVSGRPYEFPTKRWQLVKNRTGEISNDQ